MKELSYIPKKKINFDDYLAPSLDLHSVRKGRHGDYICCASAAMSMLTNKHPLAIDVECNDPVRGWRTRPIIKYLREQGFVVIELVKQTILNTHWASYPLKPDHCLLINCQMDNKENSMVIAHKGAIWHNYQEEKNPSIFFLQKFSQDVLLVYHPKWKAKKPFKNIKTIKQLAAISSRISVQK